MVLVKRQISVNPSFRPLFTVDLGEECNMIKLKLPAQLKTFKFTFECRRPGPITVEISMRKPLKRSRSQPNSRMDQVLDPFDEAGVRVRVIRCMETCFTQPLGLVKIRAKDEIESERLCLHKGIGRLINQSTTRKGKGSIGVSVIKQGSQGTASIQGEWRLRRV
ncbi:uncharacterized protein EDB91DRAFT_1338273 [Suillus paluster]|uniref:uncharacterized protein n=1 Tax=Suillus paluster TaxID=48578 RepID=UPI001B865E10|nr:uncharacterized protein EDB91DRAFT_1338273 [Suillus paluster]KAG1732622.1 hypothetical protein EDB91DRAFT_1338273 [Suillus paluster]